MEFLFILCLTITVLFFIIFLVSAFLYALKNRKKIKLKKGRKNKADNLYSNTKSIDAGISFSGEAWGIIKDAIDDKEDARVKCCIVYGFTFFIIFIFITVGVALLGDEGDGPGWLFLIFCGFFIYALYGQIKISYDRMNSKE